MQRFQTEVLLPTPEALDRAARLLLEGQVVGIPTETVYGLAGHAFDPRALARIFEAKARPAFDPLIVHLPAFPFPGVWNEKAMEKGGRAVVNRLAEAFWPGPLTLVLPRDPGVPDLATSGLPTVGVRVPAHPVARALLDRVGVPLAAPSANRFGRISPTAAADVAAELGGLIPLVLDGGSCPVGVESTILQVEPSGRLHLLRPGGIPLEAIEAAVGAPVIPVPRPRNASGAWAQGSRTEHGPRTDAQRSNAGSEIVAPGMLESHYAPSKPVVLLPAPLPHPMPGGKTPRPGTTGATARPKPAPSEERGPRSRDPGSITLPDPSPSGPLALLLQGPASPEDAEALGRAFGARRVRLLSHGGDAAEAARELFRTLRELDADPEVSWILAEPAAGDSGLRHAINDRLRRASAPRPRPGAPPESGHE